MDPKRYLPHDSAAEQGAEAVPEAQSAWVPYSSRRLRAGVAYSSSLRRLEQGTQAIAGSRDGMRPTLRPSSRSWARSPSGCRQSDFVAPRSRAAGVDGGGARAGRAVRHTATVCPRTTSRPTGEGRARSAWGGPLEFTAMTFRFPAGRAAQLTKRIGTRRHGTQGHTKWPGLVTARNCLAFSRACGGAESGACPRATSCTRDVLCEPAVHVSFVAVDPGRFHRASRGLSMLAAHSGYSSRSSRQFRGDGVVTSALMVRCALEDRVIPRSL